MENNSGFTLIELMIIICIVTLIVSFILIPTSKNPADFCNVYTPARTYSHVKASSIEELDGMLYFTSFDKYIEVPRMYADIECNYKFN